MSISDGFHGTFDVRGIKRDGAATNKSIAKSAENAWQQKNSLKHSFFYELNIDFILNKHGHKWLNFMD